MLLGKAITAGLLGLLPAWRNKHVLGVIAGDSRLGMGLIIPNIPKPNDGTVAVEETRLAGMRDHIYTTGISPWAATLQQGIYTNSTLY